MKPKILIIDDEKDLLRFFKKILREEGYSVVTACGGLEGIKRNNDSDPDLIMLDLKMPGIDGIEALRRIRKKDKDVTVIILTGYGTLETTKAAEALNVYGYASKPFNLENIKGLIKKALGSKRRKLLVSGIKKR